MSLSLKRYSLVDVMPRNWGYPLAQVLNSFKRLKVKTSPEHWIHWKVAFLFQRYLAMPACQLQFATRSRGFAALH